MLDVPSPNLTVTMPMSAGKTHLAEWAIIHAPSDRRRGDERHSLDTYRGLAARQPVLALVFTVFLLAQAGVPLTSGFLAKFYVISAAVEAHSYALAIIAMLAAVIAAFFYLRVIVVMFFSEPEADGPSVVASLPTAAAVALGLTATVVLGVLPQPVLDLAGRAASQMFVR